MPMTPNEQKFHDALKAKFAKTGGITTPLEQTLLDRLEKEFNREGETGVSNVREIIADLFKDKRTVISTERKAANLIPFREAKQSALQTINAQSELLEAQIKGININELHQLAQKSGLPQNSTKEPEAEPTVKTEPEKKEPEKLPVVVPTPAAAADYSQMTEKEAAFLKDVESRYTEGGTRKLSGIQKDVLNALKQEFSTPGQTGWDNAGKVAFEVQRKAIEDLKAGTRKLSETITRDIGPLGSQTAKDNVISDFDKKLEENQNKIRKTELDPAGKKKDKALKGLEDDREDLEKNKVKAQEGLEAEFNKHFSWTPLVDLAKKAAFPEFSETLLHPSIRKAAGADNVLDSKELQGLLKDPIFVAAAKTVGGVPLSVVNNPETGKDVLSVGTETVELGKMGIELGGTVQTGTVKAAESPEKIRKDIDAAIVKAAGADKKLSKSELEALIKNPAFLAKAAELTGEQLETVSAFNNAKPAKNDKNTKAKSDILTFNDLEVVNLAKIGIELDDKTFVVGKDEELKVQNVGTQQKPAQGTGKQ